MYSGYIIHHSTNSNYSVKNQLDIVLDTADNLTQIGQWTIGSFHKEQYRIELFLSLTRKNMNALIGFPLSPKFSQDFKKFCTSYEKLEAEFHSGIVDRTAWANGMLKWGISLTRSSELV